MIQLEARALLMSTEVKSQHVVSLLWVYAAAGIQPTADMKNMLQCKLMSMAPELTTAQLGVLWWSAAKGKTCIPPETRTLECLKRRTSELIGQFNDGALQILRWSDALLCVTHGNTTKEMMHVDILRTIQRVAPSSEMESILAAAPPSLKVESVTVTEDDTAYTFSEDVETPQDEYECYTQVSAFSTKKAWTQGDTRSDPIHPTHTLTILTNRSRTE
jgi:hypothetical protein